MKDYFLNMKTRVFNKYFIADFGTDFFFTFKIIDKNIHIHKVKHEKKYFVAEKGKVNARFWRDLCEKLHILPIELYYLGLDKTRLYVQILSDTDFILLWRDYTT